MTETMNRLSKITVLALAMSLSLGLLAPKPARAEIINPFGNIFDMRSVAGVGICILLLPICILDEKTDGAINAMTPKDLADNGYSSSEIQAITNDYQALESAAIQKNEKLTVGPQDTRESLARDIREILPTASDTFVDFYVEQAMPR